MPLHHTAKERQHKLEHAHDDQRRHAQLPSGNRCGMFVQTALFEMQKGRAKHQQRHADAGGCIQAQRHGSDIVAAGPFSQPTRHRGVGEVTQQHAERGAGKHTQEHDIGRKAEDADQSSGKEGHDRQVVDHQSKKAIEITRR
jgi:hypothetical protein